jgi:type VI secretion system secreted protein Hcp
VTCNLKENAMATDMFLKVKGIEGESQDDKHVKEIDVLSFSWGAVQQGTGSLGPGSSAGKAVIHDLSVVKYLDKASPLLFSHLAKGKHIDEIVLTARKSGGDKLEHTVITMNQCLISSINITGADNTDRVQETIDINFAKVKVDYTPQKADGSGDAKITATWDVAKQKE